MAFNNKNNQSGFTLVELAIALMIIGLLIGGVLKGIELVENARVTQVMRNVKAYETAMTSFQSIYSAMPGDMNGPATRLPNCTTAPCNVSGNGNGIINDPAASGTGATAGINTDLAIPSAPTVPVAGTPNESFNFWLHLAATNLVSGVDQTGSNTSVTDPIVWGRSFPASPVIGAGFLVQNVRASSLANYVTNARFQGHYSVLRGANTQDGVLTGNQALQIDTKFDDGIPGSGDILVASDKMTDPDCVATGAYEVNSDIKACVLFLRLSK